MSWGEQINIYSRKVYYSLYILSCFCNALSCDTRVKLVQSLVLSLLDYGAPLLKLLNQSEIFKLHVLHNTYVRIAYGGIPRDANDTPYRLSLGWLSASSWKKYLTITLTATVLEIRKPTYLVEKFRLDPGEEDLRCSKRRPCPCPVPRAKHKDL